MVNPDTLERLKTLASSEQFKNSLALSDRNFEEQYDLELVIRFIALRKRDPKVGIGDLGPFLDEEIVAIAENPDFDWSRENQIFEATFGAINTACGDNAFRRYNSENDRFVGGFSVSAFEVLALGLGYHFSDSDYVIPDLLECTKALWSEHDVVQSMRGRRSGERLRKTLSFGRTLLAK